MMTIERTWVLHSDGDIAVLTILSSGGPWERTEIKYLKRMRTVITTTTRRHNILHNSSLYNHTMNYNHYIMTSYKFLQRNLIKLTVIASRP